MSNPLELLLKDLGESLKHTDAAADASKAFKALGQSTLAKLDLVTREEFEAQQAVLIKTREKLEALEKRFNEL